MNIDDIGSELYAALRAAYAHITQPIRMGNGEATYSTANYNPLTERLRRVMAEAEQQGLGLARDLIDMKEERK